MATFTNAVLEAAALTATNAGDWISLHTGDPSTSGANEVTGGSPAYARQQTTWTGGASDGSVVGSAVDFDAPAGIFTHFGIWSAVTGGTFVGGGAFDTEAVLGAQGTVHVSPTVTADNI